MPRLWPLDTISRLSIAIAGLVVMCLMGLDFIFGLVPNPVHVVEEHRQSVSRLLAEQVTSVATRLGQQEVHQFLYSARGHESELKSLALRASSGEVVSSSGVTPPGSRPMVPDATTHLSVPILLDGKPWGALELLWAPIPAESFPGMWLTAQALWPMLTFMGVVVLLRLYLGKVLHQLDPSATVPERVRNAYNTLGEAVVMLDPSGRIVLINDAFTELAGHRSIQVGRRLEEHVWFRDGADMEGVPLPWKVALKSGVATSRVRMRLRLGDDVRVALVSCQPIAEGRQKPRGCIVVFSDQTVIERANESLQRALGELQAANDHISTQNEELTRLATRDPMTNCLNRRAFFANAGPIKDQLNLDARPAAVVMCDIDHFKSFNDKYGHSIGDEVIKAVAGIYNGNARATDMVCRYGGEEFCILLADCDEDQAFKIADMLRKLVQDTAGDGIDHDPRLTVTSSFGVAVTRSTRLPLEQLIDQADQALYHSKRNGRNRATVYVEAAMTPADAPAEAQPEPQPT